MSRTGRRQVVKSREARIPGISRPREPRPAPQTGFPRITVEDIEQAARNTAALQDEAYRAQQMALLMSQEGMAEADAERWVSAHFPAVLPLNRPEGLTGETEPG